jgi:hypothetical protein
MEESQRCRADFNATFNKPGEPGGVSPRRSAHNLTKRQSMTIDELRNALRQALETGKIGVPVSLRLHCQLADREVDLVSALAAVLPLAEDCFSTAPVSLAATQDAGQRQLNVMLQYAAGSTVFVTVGRGSAVRNRLHLLVVGNHGVVRLEGADAFDAGNVGTTADSQRWRAPVAESLKRREAVSVES